MLGGYSEGLAGVLRVGLGHFFFFGKKGPGPGIGTGIGIEIDGMERLDLEQGALQGPGAKGERTDNTF